MKRGSVCDFTGQEVRVGDTIVYWTRLSNLTRGSEAEVLDVSTETYKGRVFPVLKVQPTGRCSGFIARTDNSVQTIRTDQWVVTVPVEAKV